MNYAMPLFIYELTNEYNEKKVRNERRSVLIDTESESMKAI